MILKLQAIKLRLVAFNYFLLQKLFQLIYLNKIILVNSIYTSELNFSLQTMPKLWIVLQIVRVETKTCRQVYLRNMVLLAANQNQIIPWERTVDLSFIKK